MPGLVLILLVYNTRAAVIANETISFTYYVSFIYLMQPYKIAYKYGANQLRSRDIINENTENNTIITCIYRNIAPSTV